MAPSSCMTGMHIFLFAICGEERMDRDHVRKAGLRAPGEGAEREGGSTSLHSPNKRERY